MKDRTKNPKAQRIRIGVLLLCLLPLSAQAFAPYASRSEFLLTPPGSLGTGLQGYANPALLSYAQGLETTLAWSGAPAEQWGIFSSFHRLGFAAIHQQESRDGLTRYHLSLGVGDRRLSSGLGYGWSTRGRAQLWVLGGLLRPLPQLSLGGVVAASPSLRSRELSGDLSLRPWGDERLTLFADGARASRRAGGQGEWSVGAALTLRPGLTLTGRYFDNRTLSLGLRLGLGQAALHTQSRFDRDGEHAYAVYAVELGAYRQSALRDWVSPRRQYLELELGGPVKHRRFALFDPGHTLRELLELIQRAEEDPQIGGLVVNAAGMRANPEMAWELRQQLRRLRVVGKKVVIYIERPDLEDYHFASVADHLVLDPAGELSLEGMVAGQTYFKGVLDQLGIGFEEWRLFPYKSLFETYTRQDMSPAEREQLQALLADNYQLVMGEIGEARRLAPGTLDSLVDQQAFFLPREALAAGLVDRLGRWEERDQVVGELEGRSRTLRKPEAYPFAQDEAWGEPRRIALVYALGLCELDKGIEARELAEEIVEVRDDPRIGAVVLRVDSPGGDPLAGDLVAEAVRKCRERKPVVVSQGYVAASGGYQLSMNGSAILAAPNTITGSIGVIGGWLYNDGFKEKLGLATDKVQEGRHADLGFGATLPLLGISLPDRNLDPEEKARAQRAIRAVYDEFVAGVAQGRGRSPAAIDSVAQGRVWSGTQALGKGLVDRLGGLQAALALAREQAGLAADEAVQVLEFPRKPLLNPAFLRPPLLESGLGRRAGFELLQFRLEHNGRPLLLLPAETYGQFYPEENSR
ncbi:MAG: S49 family peptidase [Candidatus Latescibacteria bacterium]|nr:S49 family peptidase [Candidatus Latescibacterota bacterium]